MSLILSGTNGLSDVDGSAATPAIRGTDSNTGMFFPAADTVAIATGGSERMRVDSSGNVGIGTSSPAYNLDISRNSNKTSIQVDSGNNGIIFTDSGGTRYTIGSSIGVSAPGNYLAFNYYSGSAWSERARIDSSGNLLVGTTSSLIGGSNRVQVQSANQGQLIVRHSGQAAGRYWNVGVESSNDVFIIYTDTGSGVYMPRGATSWTGNSDERLKVDLKPIENAAEKVATLRAVTGRFTSDEEGVSRAFLIAQDVQAVLPEAVDVRDDEMGTLGLRYTDTIPLLVAAIKEQQALITSLTARIAALEGAAQ